MTINESLRNKGLNPYIDGSSGGHAPNNDNLYHETRIDAGYEKGSEDAAILINSLQGQMELLPKVLK